MDLDLARIYGTPGQKVASAAQEEQLEKQAQAELFAKLAGDNGIDLGTLSDDQIGGLWESTFGQKLAEDDEKDEHEAHESKAEEKKEEDDKEKKAAAELAALQEEQQKLAFADQAGRVMAHAMVNELNSINESIAKEAEDPEGHKVRRTLLGNPISAAIEARKGEKLKSFGKAYVHGAKETLKGMGAGGVGGAAIGAGVGAAAKALGKGVGGGKGALIGGLGGAYLGGAAGKIKGNLGSEASRIHGEHSKYKNASALDQLALEAAYEKAASAGYDTDEAVDRLNAVYTLGLGESEKVASAPAGDLGVAVDIRSLEYLEAAGYPVEWNQA